MTGAFVGRDPARPDDSSIRIGHPITATVTAAAHPAQSSPLPPVTPYAGGMARMWRFSPRGLGLSARDSAADYARRNGITAAATTTRVTAPSAGPTWVERTDFRRQGHAPVTLCTVHEGGHSIPGPGKGRPRILLGRTDRGFDTARAVSEFFGLATGHRPT